MDRRPRRPEPTGLDLPDALWAGIASAAASVPAAAPEPAAAQLPDWRAELLAEHGGPPPGPRTMAREDFEVPPSAPPGWVPPSLTNASIGPRPSPLAPGERKLLPQPARQEAAPPRFLRWGPGDRVRAGKDYQQLLEYVYGPRLEALRWALYQEPLFVYAKARWKPAIKGTAWWLDREGQATNRELLDHLYDRVAALMATYFDFEPAAMAHMPKMMPGALACYLPIHHVIALSDRNVQAPLAEAIDSLVHEQAHALQYTRVAAEWDGAGGAVEPYERSLVKLWAYEIPRHGLIPYEVRAIEVHAHHWGGQAASAIDAIPAPSA